MRHKKIYFEARALVADHVSGIGHYVQSVAKELDDYIGSPEHTNFELKNNTSYQTMIWAPRNHFARLHKFKFLNLRPKRFAISSHFIDRLLQKNLILPLDLWFGRGIYLFTNFSRYPLFSSKSATIIYDITFESVPQFVDDNNRRFLSKMVKRAVKKSEIIITISKHAKSEIVNFYGVPAEKIIIAYPAFDRSNYYKRSEEEISAIKHYYHLPDNYVLFVGNIEPRKNIGGLIDAYTSLPLELCQHFPLVLVGASGWLTDEIFKKIKDAKNLGYPIMRPSKYVQDSDMPAIYSGAVAFVYPSHYEGFGIPPLEAMACGIPVICADNSSLPEAVGEAAIMVKSTDTDSITRAIKQLLEDKTLREKLVKKGFEQINKFSWRTSAELIYKSVIGLSK